jgi:cAMP phosphodiesterase
VHAIPETIEVVYEHLMNDQVWFPAFESTSELPPLLLANPIQVGETREIAGLHVTAYAVEHTVPAASYVVDDGSVSVVMSADTGGGGIFGHLLPQGGSRLAAVFVEASFPNRYDLFAKKTGHMTPEILGRECEVLGDDVAVYVTHMKPGYEEELEAEVVALGRPNIQVCVQGAVLEF